jgi:hypothetical protein
VAAVVVFIMQVVEQQVQAVLVAVEMLEQLDLVWIKLPMEVLVLQTQAVVVVLEIYLIPQQLMAVQVDQAL